MLEDTTSTSEPASESTAEQEFEKLRQEVHDTAGVEASAIRVLTEFPARIQQAVADAIAGGATKAQIQQVVDEQVALMAAQREALATAIAANG